MALVAVVAATGGVGRRVVSELLQQGHQVRALMRTPSKLEVEDDKLEKRAADVSDPATLDGVFDGVDMVLSTLGNVSGEEAITAKGTANVLAAMQKSGVDRLAVISSAGVGDSRKQTGSGFIDTLALRFFVFVIAGFVITKAWNDLHEMERHIAESPVKGVCVRPTGLTDGPRTGSWTVGDADTPIGGRIARADVAAFMATLVEDNSWDDKTPSVGG